jgi:hypothetical protein
LLEENLVFNKYTHTTNTHSLTLSKMFDWY